MSHNKENEQIFDALASLERNYKLRSEARDGGVKINGFTILIQPWCYVIFKPTDIEKEPQYKGEELIKVIPDAVKLKRVYVDMALKCQPWMYY